MSVIPFQVNALFLYPLKTSENQTFSDVFQGDRIGTLTRDWLKDNGFKRINVEMVLAKFEYFVCVFHKCFFSVIAKHIMRLLVNSS